MKRTSCVLLTLICIFVLGSCNISDAFVSLEQTDTNISITADSTTPEIDDHTKIPVEITFEETTPEETALEETTLKETTPEETTPEETTSKVDEVNPPEKPSAPLTVDAIIKKLEMFESVFQEDSRGWYIYDDIMGSTVTEVLAKQKLLIAAGCNEEDILIAGKATQNLRVLLEEYNDLRTEEYRSDWDKYTALYQYYVDNYNALTKNFCDLYQALIRLYENPTVSNYIGLRGKAEHYRQLVGHLYVISTAFDRTIDRDEDAWRIDGKRLRDVIENVHYFPDGDWYP